MYSSKYRLLQQERMYHSIALKRRKTEQGSQISALEKKSHSKTKNLFENRFLAQLSRYFEKVTTQTYLKRPAKKTKKCDQI